MAELSSPRPLFGGGGGGGFFGGEIERGGGGGGGGLQTLGGGDGGMLREDGGGGGDGAGGGVVPREGVGEVSESEITEDVADVKSLALACFLPVSEIAHVGRQLADTLGASRRLHQVHKEPVTAQSAPSPARIDWATAENAVTFNNVGFNI